MNSHKFIKSAYGKISLMLILLIIGVISLRFGSASMSAAEFFRALWGDGGKNTVILYSLRLPRILAAVIAGAGLSLSGILLQAVTGNSLASPNIIGVNAGAGFAVILSLFLFPTAVYFRPFAAFAGAFGATCLIVAFASRMRASASSVIIAGIAVTTVLSSCISFLSYFDADLLSGYSYFSVGGLSGVDYRELIVPGILVGLCLGVTAAFAGKIDTLCLGDSIALSLGVNVKALRVLCLVIASLSAAAVVSYAGLLGFVGLVVPHISRRLTGSSVRELTAVGAPVGAILVTAADFLGRTVLRPTEIPVGILMSFIGAPFLFYLMVRRSNRAAI